MVVRGQRQPSEQQQDAEVEVGRGDKRYRKPRARGASGGPRELAEEREEGDDIQGDDEYGTQNCGCQRRVELGFGDPSFVRVGVALGSGEIREGDEENDDGDCRHHLEGGKVR